MSEDGTTRVYCVSEDRGDGPSEVVACQVEVAGVHRTLEGAKASQPHAVWEERGPDLWFGTEVVQKFSGPITRHYWIEEFELLA